MALIRFELLPTIDLMLDLYAQPLSIDRFKEYLDTLQGGTKGDLAMPISGFNPMAKEHVIGRLQEFKELGAEAIMRDVISEFNANSDQNDPEVFKIALNLSDDLKGGWTNRYTSDFDNRFKINALVKRKFCTPVFWTSELFDHKLIRRRTLESIHRTIYWTSNSKPATLRQHVDQEIFVASRVRIDPGIHKVNSSVENYLRSNEDSDRYHVIFNFFYGSEAAKSLEFPVVAEIDPMAGFGYVNAMASTFT